MRGQKAPSIQHQRYRCSFQFLDYKALTVRSATSEESLIADCWPKRYAKLDLHKFSTLTSALVSFHCRFHPLEPAAVCLFCHSFILHILPKCFCHSRGNWVQAIQTLEVLSPARPIAALHMFASFSESPISENMTGGGFASSIIEIYLKAIDGSHSFPTFAVPGIVLRVPMFHWNAARIVSVPAGHHQFPPDRRG